ncbi:hypothetical protein BDM02DRAFT_3129845 [Thelephora ganbajun]|uniref:Uncharacterized protein n=1 Tax=Thelephora ganbajun TaxID=370292 RepID=A0ACB6ZCJ3_THEGA|nr:hypothetical protein BDM02DRAFT_3129845 [Thelephora ganbajun]
MTNSATQQTTSLSRSHSSTSAIFERDIEPISISPPSTHPDPHRTARGHNSEALEQSVPSVLDAAVEALSSTNTTTTSGISSPNLDDGEIAVIAPHPVFSSQSSSTSPRSTSRSPSPGGPKSNRASMLLNLPNLLPQSTSPNLTAVSLPPATGPAFAIAVSNSELVQIDKQPISASANHSIPPSVSSSPGTATDHMPPTRATTWDTLSSSNASGYSPNLNASSKRLSFISYTDLLTSTPSSTLPLSSLTTSITPSNLEPPSRSLIIEPEVDGETPASVITSERSLRGRRSNLSGIHSSFQGTLTLLDANQGGEWEREGLGLGLEERLEMASQPGSPAVAV